MLNLSDLKVRQHRYLTLRGSDSVRVCKGNLSEVRLNSGVLYVSVFGLLRTFYLTILLPVPFQYPS